ncbi:MAG: hypothetical protein H7Y43_06710 [Akkermansiaceae bacterium]|nr:hypothetical protein [Verrucomicrobiales bacterium]
MLKQRLILVLLCVTCFSLAIWLQASETRRDEAAQRSDSFLSLVLGDGRKLFANEVFAKADAYFHRGNYPSIFDVNAKKEENHMSDEAVRDEQASEEEHNHEGHDHADEPAHKEKPAGPPARDWIEAFGQKFQASTHLHLEEGAEKEMLPWLKLAAELDPQNIEAYVVSSYWLIRLKRVDDAEQFLREGLRRNPGNVEILHELGWLYFKERKDFNRARNIWGLARAQWHKTEESKEEPDKQLLRGILGGLFKLELEAGNPNAAIETLKQLKVVSPMPESIQRLIDELATKGALPPPQ